MINVLRAARGVLLITTVVTMATGCSSNRRLDMADLVRGLEEQMRVRIPSARDVAAECPTANSVAVGKGVSFQCSVSVDGRRILVTMTQTDDHGHVSSLVDG